MSLDARQNPSDYRLWWILPSGKLVTLDEGYEHIAYIEKHPRKFGIARLERDANGDVILSDVYKNGAVRLVANQWVKDDPLEWGAEFDFDNTTARDHLISTLHKLGADPETDEIILNDGLTGKEVHLSLSRLVSANPDIRRNPIHQRRGWWILPNGLVEEVGEHGHTDWLLENSVRLGLFTGKYAPEINEQAGKKGFLRLIRDYDWTYPQREKIKPGHSSAWGVELDTSALPAAHPQWRRHLRDALAMLNAWHGEQIHVYDVSTDKHRQFAWGAGRFVSNPDIRRNPEEPKWIKLLPQIERIAHKLWPGPKYDDDWCGPATDAIVDFLRSQGVQAQGVWGNFEGDTGIEWDQGHAFVVMPGGTVIDATIRQFIDSPRASAGQKRKASAYPSVKSAPSIAVVPPEHPFYRYYLIPSDIRRNPVTDAKPDLYVSWSSLKDAAHVHPPDYPELTKRLRDSMRQEGWNGPPLVIYGLGSRLVTFLTGVHRAEAIDALALTGAGKLKLEHIPVITVRCKLDKGSLAELKTLLRADSREEMADILLSMGFPKAAKIVELEGWH